MNQLIKRTSQLLFAMFSFTLCFSCTDGSGEHNQDVRVNNKAIFIDDYKITIIPNSNNQKDTLCIWRIHDGFENTIVIAYLKETENTLDTIYIPSPSGEGMIEMVNPILYTKFYWTKLNESGNFDMQRFDSVMEKLGFFDLERAYGYISD